MKLAHWPRRTDLGRAIEGVSAWLLVLTICACGGCASTDESPPEWAGVKGENEPAPLVKFVDTAKIHVRWHSNVGSSGANPQRPAVAKDAVYGVSGNGILTRLDRVSGKQVWRVATGVIVSSGGVADGGGIALVGGDKGDVMAYTEDGGLRWKSMVSSEVLSISPVVGGIVLVRTGDGRITCLDATDGRRLWIYERSTPALVVRSHAGVVIDNGVAYAGFAGGKLVAINVKNGEMLWEAVVSQPSGSTELERISDVTSDPLLDGKQVCAIAFQGRVACFDAAQGSPLWSRDISSDKGMTVDGKHFYVTDARGSIIAIDKTSGSTMWKNEQLALRDITAPAAFGNLVVVGDYEGFLHCLNKDDGRFVARIQLNGGAIRAAPIATDDGFVVQTKAGEVYSLSVD
jgi:outer membrane protein assembly factor BamB